MGPYPEWTKCVCTRQHYCYLSTKYRLDGPASLSRWDVATIDLYRAAEALYPDLPQLHVVEGPWQVKK